MYEPFESITSTIQFKEMLCIHAIQLAWNLLANLFPFLGLSFFSCLPLPCFLYFPSLPSENFRKFVTWKLYAYADASTF